MVVSQMFLKDPVVLCRQADRQPKDCGVLAVRVDMADGVLTAELAAVHCAASMAVSYLAGGRDGAMKVWWCKLLPLTDCSSKAIVADAST